jgi:two-component system chemotaxis sensor kinase CheA
MQRNPDGFLKQLRATFMVEAQEHLQVISAGLLALEQTTAGEAQRRIVENVFRAAHSLKGAARAVDMRAVESRCQSLEEVLAAWRRGEGGISPESIDAMHRVVDAVTTALNAAEPASAKVETVAPAARAFAGPSPEHAAVEVSAAFGETVRVPVARLEERLLQAEEMLATKLAARQRVSDLLEVAQHLEAWQRAWSKIEPEARALRLRAGGAGAESAIPMPAELAGLLDFCEWGADHLKGAAVRALALRRIADQDRYAICKLIDQALDDSKRLLLLPFSTISAGLPKVVRDLCRDQGKEAELIVRGDDIELDKRILEEMKDPLIHLLRNSVDHGIEQPEERKLHGKAPRGTITITASRVGTGKVQILVSDDGVGIDSGKVRASAVSAGRIAAEAAGQLDEGACNELVFLSEVSTSPVITRLSGRGLGLAIVREKAARLGGEATVESHKGQGTAFRIIVPATRSTFRGILIQSSRRMFIVPTIQVERVMRVALDDVRTMEGRETMAEGERAVALARLADVLQLPSQDSDDADSGGLTVFITGAGDQRMAFVVDAVLDEQEVLVKPLPKPLARVRNIAAATVLGTGEVVPILNIADLVQSARKVAGSTARPAAPAKPEARKHVLVAEDSITSRMLIKAILEGAGYRVTTAVDGLEAFSLLRAEAFDLVVSDVEMPRLDGFGLTARIRADQKLADLPVVLVTALESAEDRERGIDAGASAYLVKSSFDQGHLLEALRRLT